MAAADVSLEEDALRQRAVARRLQILLAAHILLSGLPATVRFLPAQMQFQPTLLALVQCVLQYPALGQMMLLGLWAGLGTGRTTSRLTSTLLGCAYLAIWPTFGPTWSSPATWADCLSQYRRAAVFIYVLVGMLAAA